MLTMGVFAGILVIMALAIRSFDLDFGMLLVHGLLLSGLVGGAAVWLRSVAARWRAAS
jgi:hypothetical protein